MKLFASGTLDSTVGKGPSPDPQVTTLDTLPCFLIISHNTLFQVHLRQTRLS